MSKFAQDVARYRLQGSGRKDLWLNPALWAVASYRLSHWLYVEKPSAITRLLLKPLAFLLAQFCFIFMEMDISSQATIGGGLYIGHIGGVHIHPAAILGENCDVAHRVTIGASAMGRQGAPVLGDGVYVGTGATLVGKIRIGSGAKIAANTLVMSHVPAGATVMGVPGRIVMRAKPTAPVAAAVPPVVVLLTETETLHAD